MSSDFLHLNLHREFFAPVAAETKRIEYRSRTTCWRRRVDGRHYDVIQLCNTYAIQSPERFPSPLRFC